MATKIIVVFWRMGQHGAKDVDVAVRPRLPHLHIAPLNLNAPQLEAFKADGFDVPVPALPMEALVLLGLVDR